LLFENDERGCSLYYERGLLVSTQSKLPRQSVCDQRYRGITHRFCRELNAFSALVSCQEFRLSAKSASTRTTKAQTDDDIPVGYEAFFFDIGRFTYYVTVAFAMGQGISLNVFEGEKEVVDLFSGTDDGTDFVTPYMFVKTRISGNAVLRPSTPWHLLNN